jgi:hypothetical protein
MAGEVALQFRQRRGGQRQSRPAFDRRPTRPSPIRFKPAAQRDDRTGPLLRPQPESLTSWAGAVALGLRAAYLNHDFLTEEVAERKRDQLAAARRACKEVYPIVRLARTAKTTLRSPFTSRAAAFAAKRSPVGGVRWRQWPRRRRDGVEKCLTRMTKSLYCLKYSDKCSRYRLTRCDILSTNLSQYL